MDAVNPRSGFRWKLPDVSPESAMGVIGRLFKDTGRRYWLGYSIASVFMLLVSGSSAATAWIMKDVVNEVFIDHHGEWLVYLAVMMVIISVVRGIGVFGSSVAMSRIGNSIVARTQK